MKWLARLFTKRSNWSLPYFIFLLLFVVLPLVLIFIYAFQDNDGNFTLENFSKFISNPEAANTFVYSSGVAIITTLICILLGYPAAYILSNRELCRSRVMVVMFILPSSSVVSSLPSLLQAAREATIRAAKIIAKIFLVIFSS